MADILSRPQCVKHAIMSQTWVTKPISPITVFFPVFPNCKKCWLSIEYHVHIWQVSPQLRCSDNCQIWLWFKDPNRYFNKIENFHNGEVNKWSFINPQNWDSSHPLWAHYGIFTGILQKDRLVQEKCNSSVLVELRLSCTKPSRNYIIEFQYGRIPAVTYIGQVT